VLVKEIDTIKLEEEGRYYLSKTERYQFEGRVLIVRRGNRLYFLNEEESQLFQGFQEPVGLRKLAIRRLDRNIGRGIISLSLVRIDSRGRISVPPSMRKKKRAR